MNELNEGQSFEFKVEDQSSGFRVLTREIIYWEGKLNEKNGCFFPKDWICSLKDE